MWEIKTILRIGWICWFVAVIVLLLMIRPMYAADASFSWLPNSESDLAGYKIHYGSLSRAYETTIDVGLPDPINGRVQYTIKDVPPEITYFAATAYDTGGLESDYSEEVEFNPAPSPPADPVIVQVTVTVTVQ